MRRGVMIASLVFIILLLSMSLVSSELLLPSEQRSIQTGNSTNWYYIEINKVDKTELIGIDKNDRGAIGIGEIDGSLEILGRMWLVPAFQHPSNSKWYLCPIRNMDTINDIIDLDNGWFFDVSDSNTTCYRYDDPTITGTANLNVKASLITDSTAKTKITVNTTVYDVTPEDTGFGFLFFPQNQQEYRYVYINDTWYDLAGVEGQVPIQKVFNFFNSNQKSIGHIFDWSDMFDNGNFFSEIITFGSDGQKGLLIGSYGYGSSTTISIDPLYSVDYSPNPGEHLIDGDVINDDDSQFSQIIDITSGISDDNDATFYEVKKYTTILPNSLTNSDEDSLDYTEVDETVPGDTVYEYTGKGSDPVNPPWIQCGYPRHYVGRDFTNQSFNGHLKIALETVDNERFWIPDCYLTGKVHYVNDDGTLISQFDCPSGTTIGITTINGSDFWFIDGGDIVWHTDNAGQIIDNFSVDSQFSVGIATVDGSEFWILDDNATGRSVYKVNSSGSTLNVYPLDFVEGNVRKIDTVNGSEFWFSDSTADAIWHTNSSFNLIDSIDVSSTGPAVYGVTTTDGLNFWITQATAERVFEISSIVPPDAVINNMTFYWGHYDENNWALTTQDNYTGLVWSPDGTSIFYNITEYTVSTTDIDENYMLTTNLPTASQLNNGIYFRFIGYDSNAGGEDDLFLDYCYFDVNYDGGKGNAIVGKWNQTYNSTYDWWLRLKKVSTGTDSVYVYAYYNESSINSTQYTTKSLNGIGWFNINVSPLMDYQTNIVELNYTQLRFFTDGSQDFSEVRLRKEGDDSENPIINNCQINDTNLTLNEIALLECNVTDNLDVDYVEGLINTTFYNFTKQNDIYYYNWLCNENGNFYWDLTNAYDIVGNNDTLDVNFTFTCEFCIQNITNTSWTPWVNITCLSDDTMNQSRNRTEYDSNYCGEVGNTTYIEYQNIEFCDYCTPNLVNTSWSLWLNESCLINNTMNQSRFLTEYDNNYCEEIVNITYYEYQIDGPCDYCIENIINTSWTLWVNITCLPDDTMNQSRYLTEYDNNSCGTYENVTYTEYRHTEFCDYNVTCEEDWSVQYGSCLIDDTRLKYYIDLNNCNTTVNLPGDNGTYPYCDYCSEDIVGPYYDPTTCINETQIRYYIDNNYDVCCAVTSIFSDCSIDYSPYLNSTVDCITLITTIEIDVSETVYLDDRMYFMARINETNSTKCWSYVKKEGKILQTNPQKTEYSMSVLMRKKTEDREYFTPVKGRVNAYWTDQNIIPYDEFTLGIRCALENGSIITGEKHITHQYEDLRKVTARSVWGTKEMAMLVITVVIILFVLGLVIYAWKK